MNQLISLSFLDIMHEQKKSYLEIFKPIILYHIPEDGIYLSKLCNNLNSSGILKIQYKSLEFIIRNMKDLIELKNYKSNDYYIEFKKNINMYEIKKEQEQINENINNNLNNLFDDFINYFQDKTGKTINTKQAEKYITNFIQENVYDILSSNSKKVFNSDENLIVYQYIMLISKYEEYKEIYRTIQTIIRGSIIAKEIDNKESFSYKNIFTTLLKIVLDSNFIINLLGYGNKITVEATLELFNELKEIKNIHFICYQHTYDEIYSKISKYQSYIDNHKYIDKNDGIYGYFYSNKLRTPEIELILLNLEKNIKSLGITCINLSQKEELEYESYAKFYNINNEIRKVKEEKKIDTYINEKSLDHDTFLFSIVAKQCNKHAKELEDNRYIILTSDISLAKNNSRFAEFLKCPNIIISDMQFAVKLFIHNGCKSSSLTINQILKYHANSLIIDNNIWDKIVTIIEQMLNNYGFTEHEKQVKVYSKIKEALCFNSTLQSTLHDKNISDDKLKILLHNIISDDSQTEYIKNKELIQQNNILTERNIELEKEKQHLSSLHDKQKQKTYELKNENTMQKQTINSQALEIEKINNQKGLLEISKQTENDQLKSENVKLKKIIIYLIIAFTISLTSLMLYNLFNQ